MARKKRDRSETYRIALSEEKRGSVPRFFFWLLKNILRFLFFTFLIFVFFFFAGGPFFRVIFCKMVSFLPPGAPLDRFWSMAAAAAPSGRNPQQARKDTKTGKGRD